MHYILPSELTNDGGGCTSCGARQHRPAERLFRIVAFHKYTNDEPTLHFKSLFRHYTQGTRHNPLLGKESGELLKKRTRLKAYTHTSVQKSWLLQCFTHKLFPVKLRSVEHHLRLERVQRVMYEMGDRCCRSTHSEFLSQIRDHFSRY